jgi:ATP-dependent Clp protease protease subunit
MLIPCVIEKTKSGERSYDIYSRLLEDRIIFIGSEITDDLANSVVAQLLLLNQQDKEKDIALYINSPGGSITAGLAIIDTMKFVSADVCTICIGQAASMGADILACGAKGKRCSLPHSRVMTHEAGSGGVGGSRTEQEIHFKELDRLNNIMAEILSENSGKPKEELLKMWENDTWMGPQEALDLGIIDRIITSEGEIK